MSRGTSWNRNNGQQKINPPRPSSTVEKLSQGEYLELLHDVADCDKPGSLSPGFDKLLAQRDHEQRRSDADHHEGALDDPNGQVSDSQGFIELPEQRKRKYRDETIPILLIDTIRAPKATVSPYSETPRPSSPAQ